MLHDATIGHGSTADTALVFTDALSTVLLWHSLLLEPSSTKNATHFLRRACIYPFTLQTRYRDVPNAGNSV